MTVLSMVPTDTPFLPAHVSEVPREVLRNYPHSKKVGQYLLGTTLGEGSFAKVKEALHIPTGEKVAIKIIDKKKTREDSYVRKNLRREGKILQMIRHANIVQLLEIMETQNSYYLVTELCRGGDLMDYIAQRRKLPEAEVRKYIRQIVSAVDYLHRLGILHRDLKIENLLLDEYKDMKIIDFGLSNCVRLVQTKEGPRVQDFCVTQCGSPAYAAPELLGRKKYGPQVDVWSIGVNMYAMLTGNLPFTVEPFNIKTLHAKMVAGQMNPLPDGVSRDCRDLIKRLLNPDPDRRISVEEMLKHPWIAEGPASPWPRAPCPNKVKTDSVDNSILRHMSDNQGFRIGEVIRYVTGNVPSSATAMYYLINRKLQKHYGSLRASGKIAAEQHRVIKNHNDKLIQARLSRPTTGNKPSTPAPVMHHPATPHPSPIIGRQQTGNIIRITTNTPVRMRERTGSQGDSESESPGASSRGTDEDKPEEASEAFTDIMQTAPTGPQIPRAHLAKKPASPIMEADTPPTGSLPRSAHKYTFNGRRSTTQSTAMEHTRPLEHHPTEQRSTETVKSVMSERRPRTPETLDETQKPFRPRAFTFPGKIQRPSISLSKNVNHKRSAEHVSETDKSDNAARVRLYRTKVDCHVATTKEKTSSQTSPRKSSAFQRDQLISPTPRTAGNSQQIIQFRKHSAVQRRIVYVQKSKDTEKCHESSNDDDVIHTVVKHLTSRPARTNRFTRTGSQHDGGVLEEAVTDIPRPPTRPISSMKSPLPANFRAATPVFPALAPDSGKR